MNTLNIQSPLSFPKEMESVRYLENKVKDSHIEINIELPDLVSAPKNYFKNFANMLPFSGACSLAWSAQKALRGKFSFSNWQVASGFIVGAGASSLVRGVYKVETPKENLLQLEGVKEVFHSTPFTGAMATTALVASLATTYSLVFNSLPILISGIAVDYLATQAEKENFISEGQKKMIQATSTFATATLALLEPTSSMIAFTVGACAGVYSEAFYAKNNKA